MVALQRRYDVSRQTVQNALQKLSEDNLAERGAGQQWLLKQFALGTDAVGKSYEFRLATRTACPHTAGFSPRPAGT